MTTKVTYTPTGIALHPLAPKFDERRFNKRLIRQGDGTVLYIALTPR